MDSNEEEAKRELEFFLKTDGKQHNQIVSQLLKQNRSYTAINAFLKVKSRPSASTTVILEHETSENLNLRQQLEETKRKVESSNEIQNKKVKIEPGLPKNAFGNVPEDEPEFELDKIVTDPFHVQDVEKFRLQIENARPWAFMMDMEIKEKNKGQSNERTDSSNSVQLDRGEDAGEELEGDRMMQNPEIESFIPPPQIELSKESKLRLASICEMLAQQESEDGI